jgi:hypothetical protein
MSENIKLSFTKDDIFTERDSKYFESEKYDLLKKIAALSLACDSFCE